MLHAAIDQFNLHDYLEWLQVYPGVRCPKIIEIKYDLGRPR